MVRLISSWLCTVSLLERALWAGALHLMQAPKAKTLRSVCIHSKAGTLKQKNLVAEGRLLASYQQEFFIPGRSRTPIQPASRATLLLHCLWLGPWGLTPCTTGLPAEGEGWQQLLGATNSKKILFELSPSLCSNILTFPVRARFFASWEVTTQLCLQLSLLPLSRETHAPIKWWVSHAISVAKLGQKKMEDAPWTPISPHITSVPSAQRTQSSPLPTPFLPSTSLQVS